MILVALGANLPSAFGDAEQTLRAAVEAIRVRGINVTACSGIWESPPWPVDDGQPWYRNAVIAVETAMAAPELIAALHRIEEIFGRLRDADNQNASRTLDLDLIAYHDEVIGGGGLYVPHSRMHSRAFVLYPLQEVAPRWIHPLLKRSVVQLIDDLPDDVVIRRSEGLAA